MAIVFIMGIALQSIVGAGGQGGASSGTGEDVGEFFAALPSGHLPRGATFGEYTSFPPTSGPHWNVQSNPDTPVPCGIYDVELADEQVVHNMEHGHVVISHNLTDPEQIADLEAIAKDLPADNRWMVMRPYSRIDEGEVVITAWEWLQRFDGVDSDGLRDFYGAHNGNGPEFVPC